MNRLFKLIFDSPPLIAAAIVCLVLWTVGKLTPDNFFRGLGAAFAAVVAVAAVRWAWPERSSNGKGEKR